MAAAVPGGASVCPPVVPPVRSPPPPGGHRAMEADPPGYLWDVLSLFDRADKCRASTAAGRAAAAHHWLRATRSCLTEQSSSILSKKSGQCLHLENGGGGGGCLKRERACGHRQRLGGWPTARLRRGGGARPEIAQREARAHGTSAPRKKNKERDVACVSARPRHNASA